MSELNWVRVGSGRVTLSHRPKLKEIAKLPEHGCQRVVTIQGPHESPHQIEQAVRGAGLAWTLVPVGSARFPEGESDRLMRCGLQEVIASLASGESVLIHCSAGIHRTGMFAFALLRSLGLSELEALDRIGAMRAHTREWMHEEHKEWGNRLATGCGEKDAKPA